MIKAKKSVRGLAQSEMIGPRLAVAGLAVASRSARARSSRALRLGAVGLTLACLWTLASCSGSVQPSAASTAAAPSSTVWLCRPGMSNNPCVADLTTTVVRADGAATVQRVAAARNPAIDCFYVYPTVSRQSTLNANLSIDPEERAAALVEASRFSQVCRVYAPMYRQVTGKGFTSPATRSEAAGVANASLLSAWTDYLAHYSHGRGVVLIGHSQGASVLIDLIKSQVDPTPAIRHQLVSAILLGGNVLVPVGEDVGGSFQHIPACRTARQTGCVVAYSMYNTPPPTNSYFGRVIPAQYEPWQSISQAQAVNLQVLCTNPASLAGSSDVLDPYFITTPQPFKDNFPMLFAPAPDPPDPWVNYPDLYAAQCRNSSGASWLQVDDIAGPGDHRSVVSQDAPQVGLHAEDMVLAYGNLVALVRQQAAARPR